MIAYEHYWAQNPEWTTFKNGRRVLTEKAPKKTRKSFEKYLKQKAEYAKKYPGMDL